MTRFLKIVCLIVLPVTAHGQLVSHWETGPDMLRRIANNAVCALTIDDTCFVYSLLGIDSTKIWSGITQQAFRLNTRTGEWSELPSVPGDAGRIAAHAQSFDGKIYLFGGYEVRSSGSEITWPNVDIYDPVANEWSSGAICPVRVDDQVTAVWRDSLIYSISGWSTNTNVRAVQIYDPELDMWQQATQIPGSPVFGHAGAIAGDIIIYLGGCRIQGFNFVLSNEAWMGVINPADPTDIDWQQLDLPPQGARYRAAAAAFGSRIIFAGGTDNPYNFNGIGYNGQPAESFDDCFGYNIETNEWETYTSNLLPTMDHRQLAVCGDSLFLVGGMEGEQEVSSQVSILIVDSLISDALPQSILPGSIQLHPVYPNPFNGAATISFSLTHSAQVSLELVDLHGRHIQNLIENLQFAPGEHALTLDAIGLTSGSHFLRLATPAVSQVKRIVYVK